MTDRRPTLCLVMMVKNEERTIRRALLSAAPYIDRFVICDTGSTDSTKQVILDTVHRTGVPGEIVDVPWVDFGHNRSEAVRLGRESGADYTLMLDADLELVVNEPNFRSNLTADAYELRYLGDLDYTNTRIFSSKHDWRYEGVTHEYPTCSTAVRVDSLPGVRLRDYADGGNRGDKFERDIRLLTGAIERNPDDARSTFYLANSYRDLGKTGEALFWYERRSQMPGFVEETWYALYQKAVMMDRLRIRTADVVQAYMAAYSARTCRLEPLYKIVEKLHAEGRFHEAMVYASIWIVGFPYPKTDRLFIDAPVYTYLMPLIAARLCLCTGRVVEGERIVEKLLTEEIPDWVVLEGRRMLGVMEATHPVEVEPVMRRGNLGNDYFLTIVRHDEGYVHSLCFLDTAKALNAAFRELGHESSRAINFLDMGAINIVFGVHLLSRAEAMSLPENTIIFNLEQLGISWTPEWYMQLSSRYTIWDYTPINIDRWKRESTPLKGLDIVEIGYSPAMESKFLKESVDNGVVQDIDVLFYGCLTDRRLAIIDQLKSRGLRVEAVFGIYGEDLDRLIARSKVVLNVHARDAEVFEIVRVGYLLANGKAVVSEWSADTPKLLRDAMFETPYANLTHACVTLIEDDPVRTNLERVGYEIFRKSSQTKLLGKVLG